MRKRTVESATLLFSLLLIPMITLLALSPGQWQFWVVAIGVLPGIVMVVRRFAQSDDPELLELRKEAAREKQKWQEEASAGEAAKQDFLKEAEIRSDELARRERNLMERCARIQEFLDYPLEDVHAGMPPAELQKLAESDRAVRQLLEKEAERVYEKIRANGYTVNGKVDLITIRDEALSLMQRVAHIYRPESQTPILDTSLEQLARAASRVWLHLLVLMEQLPINVQEYNIATLYGYFRKAVVGYGVYQKAGPWLTYLSRGMYAGRMAAATNPASLGAWWLATELGKQGAKKVIENVVDRQAIAVLHQLIAVVGMEAASLYGPGVRQRDPAWIHGAELVELIATFPASGDSLRHGLKVVTGLPLRSEYDRIYLYRCLANHRTVSARNSDPTMLTREEREAIAQALETFFRQHIHGATEAVVRKWRDGVEHRLDLRLKLDESAQIVPTQRSEQLLDAMRSLLTFAKRLVQVPQEKLDELLPEWQLTALLSDPQRQSLIAESAYDETDSYEPPEIDPSSDLTELFLKDLSTSCTLTEHPSDELEQLVFETGRYFRRAEADVRRWIQESWRLRLSRRHGSTEVIASLDSSVPRLVCQHLRQQEQLVFCYGGVSAVRGTHLEELTSAWLLGLQSSDGARRIVVGVPGEDVLLWESAGPFHVERVSGILVDDAKVNVDGSESIEISGNMRGGRFKTYFAPLLAWNVT